LTQPCGKPGASGSVFKIEYQGKVAAVKEFHKHMHDMLRRELKTLQLLAHPNIVRVLAVVTDAASQPMGFVMEHVPIPLDEGMQRMTLRQAVHALAEACIGVAAAHDSQIIHSDIKPGNILCSDDFSVVKLADFGLAHAITASMSAVSGVRGTALFMAPELHDDAVLSVATDVFSFGMLMRQVLHPDDPQPFGPNAMTIMRKLDKGERPAFTRSDAPPALKELVARCLEHDPAKRPPSMWDVHRELKAILQQLQSVPAFSSKFSKFDGYYSATPLPNFADELLAAVRKTIFKYSSKNGAEQAAAEQFFKSLQAEAFTHAKDLSESISVSAGLIWTSQLRLTMRDGSSTEFCGILNRILRDVDDDLLPDACVVVRAINSLCVLRHDPSKLMYPAGGMTYRGGGMPLLHVMLLPGQPPPFFVAGKKYRIPMFLATTDKRHVAENFMVMAAARGDTPVIWTIKVDPRGAAQLLYRCKHVNQVAKSNVPGEFEFLYAPYSVVTVERVTLPPAGAAPTPDCPILIVIVAALDNKDEPQDLPLAPWA
jgi:serine/threonine protein kinase